ncbi:unnamed protein product [Macrosiphum euphorbiae]|uniref:HAT C-terminal dimerisation domain-containing protein n=1 Tax=Macrosiphum euphorbiae TaxID=13131 RepID=A0AAV0W4E3_9HEMI|nr:unnamed protein product [Macrosiphum euphorbiae]
MNFKNITLEKNSKLININQNQFLTSLVDNLKARLLDNEQDISILQDMQIIDVSEWPKDINYNNIRYGEDEIKRLCKRFQVNKNDAINGFRQILDDQTVSFKNVMPEFYNLVQTFPRSTAECERGFSLMNNICTKLRSTLTIKHLASLMFINVNGPPLDEWEPKSYVSSWLVNHKTAENTRTKKNVNKEPETREEKKSIWKIL